MKSKSCSEILARASENQSLVPSAFHITSRCLSQVTACGMAGGSQALVSCPFGCPLHPRKACRVRGCTGATASASPGIDRISAPRQWCHPEQLYLAGAAEQTDFKKKLWVKGIILSQIAHVLLMFWYWTKLW